MTMISRIAETFVVFFGSLQGIRSMIDRPLNDTRPLQQRCARLRTSDEQHETLIERG